ncbi:MAG: 8-amino-7-oxononanoate synthase [Bacteroides sp.]|nr:8-amino-7-oxononanoate synthase [Bacteroides sp.]
MAKYSDILYSLETENRLRSIPRHRKGAPLVDLTSNDYMGLARRADEWKDEFRQRFPDVGMTSSASRLLASDQEIYNRLEGYLEDLYRKPALLFNSGYHANVGIISALNIPGTLFITDKLIHASAIDGIRLGKAEFRRFAHNDISHLEKIIEKEHRNHERLIVICESVYSMDGDVAPLAEMAALKKLYPNVMLYVDEAHAVGAIGSKGAGVASQLGLVNDIDIIVGTFGKACASQGAFAVTSQELKSYLINTARSFIFSTALPPANVAWTLFMLEKLALMDKEREHLKQISEMFRSGLEDITGNPINSASAIIPLLTGDARRAMALSASLEESGILALPIRRPTVPPGGERIRFSLTAALSEEIINNVLENIKYHLKNIEI